MMKGGKVDTISIIEYLNSRRSASTFSFLMELNYLLSDNSILCDHFHSTFFGNSDIGSLTDASLEDYNSKSIPFLPNVSSCISIALPELSHELLSVDQGLTLSNLSDPSVSSSSSETTVPFASMYVILSCQFIISQESSLSDEDSTLSPKSRRSGNY